jgi:hypothetical protein
VFTGGPYGREQKQTSKASVVSRSGSARLAEHKPIGHHNPSPIIANKPISDNDEIGHRFENDHFLKRKRRKAQILTNRQSDLRIKGIKEF